MNCPLCSDQMMLPHYRAGIEVDVCPNCKGLWLDRGELEKLLDDDERSGYARSMSGASTWPPTREPETEQYSPKYAREGRQQGKSKRKRKKTLAQRLGDVLDEVLD